MERIDRLNPILEILKHSPSRVIKIFVQKENTPHRAAEVIRRARENSIPYVFVPRKNMDRESPHHQGVIAELAAKEFIGLDDIIEASECPFLVALDEIEDPQNFGAIVRSAECAGVDGIIIPERRSAGPNETVATVSAGALAHMKIARVTNLVRALEELKARDIRVIGAEASGEGPWFAADYTGPIAIVLGSEGRGLRPLVRKTCDTVLSIPLSGRVNSLNVSAAAAVFLFEAVRQRLGKGPKGRPAAADGPRHA